MERELRITPVVTRFDNPEISLSVIDLKGVNRYVVNTENTAVYVCTKGIVVFAINRKGIFSLKTLREGESIKILPETPYLDFSEKGATIIAVNKGAFDPGQVVELPIPDVLAKTLQEMDLVFFY